MTGLAWEKSYPWIIAGLAAVSGAYLPPLVHQRMAETLFGQAVIISSISVGFLATTQGLLVTLAEKPPMRRYSKSQYFDDFLSYLRQAILVALALLVCSVGGSLYSEKIGLGTFRIFIPVWIFLFVSTLFTLYRVVSVASYLLQATGSRADQSQRNPPPKADPSALEL